MTSKVINMNKWSRFELVGSPLRITVVFVRFGRADQNSSVLMDVDHGREDSGCWLRFTALFSSFALSRRKPLPHFFFFPSQSSPWRDLNTLWVFQDTIPPPARLPFLSSSIAPVKSSSSFPAKYHMKPCQLHSWYYHPRLLPRKRCFP